jgi:hypothetical protein
MTEEINHDTCFEVGDRVRVFNQLGCIENISDHLCSIKFDGIEGLNIYHENWVDKYIKDCNVCDTEYTKEEQVVAPEIEKRIRFDLDKKDVKKLVDITKGEHRNRHSLIVYYGIIDSMLENLDGIFTWSGTTKEFKSYIESFGLCESDSSIYKTLCLMRKLPYFFITYNKKTTKWKIEKNDLNRKKLMAMIKSKHFFESLNKRIDDCKSSDVLEKINNILSKENFV